MFFKHIIAIPLVWVLLPFFLIIDILAEIYHRICFPLYNMPYVQRNKYIKMDRHKLKYLTLFQKASCVYCGYANGLLAYWVEMAAATLTLTTNADVTTNDMKIRVTVFYINMSAPTA